MLIYRIEHSATRKGPFTNWTDGRNGIDLYSAVCGWRLGAHCWPEPEEESLKFSPGYHLCGCESPAALREWFPVPMGLKAMADHGYVLSVYDCPEEKVNRGRRQVTFPMGMPKVETLQLSTLWERQSEEVV